MKKNSIKRSVLKTVTQMVRVEIEKESNTNSFCAAFLHQPKRPILEGTKIMQCKNGNKKQSVRSFVQDE